MNKLFFVLLVLCATYSTASIARVQGKSGGICDNSGTTIACTFPGNVTAANSYIACVSGSTLAASYSIASSLGNTLTSIIGPVAPGGGISRNAQCWYAKNIAGGSETVTVTDTQNVFHQLFIEEYSGGSTTSLLGASTSSSGVSNSPASGALTVISGSLIVSFVFGDGGYSAVAPLTAITPTGIATVLGDFTASTTDGSNSWTTGPADWGVISFELKASGGGGATAVPRRGQRGWK